MEKLARVLIFLIFLAACGGGGDTGTPAAIIKSATIPYDTNFDFSTGTTVTSGGDFKYISSSKTLSNISGGAMEPYGSTYAEFQHYASTLTAIPTTIEWWEYIDEGRNFVNTVRWFKTKEKMYALVFVVSTSPNVFIQYIYPYGSYTY